METFYWNVISTDQCIKYAVKGENDSNHQNFDLIDSIFLHYTYHFKVVVISFEHVLRKFNKSVV